ncbi:MAG: hypothetical protein HRU07_06300 [Nitrosopumilus sp.]|nr:hypothetical protein [Nitrosopumilus sp.]NRA05755.1 hypothetical protein [Nitrosopumilus sp.]
MGLFDKKPPVEDYDVICTECGKEISRKEPYCPHCKCNVVISKKKSTLKKELTDEVQEDKKQLIGKVKNIKKLWKNKEIVQLKTDAIAVLFKKRGYEDEFFTEFDNLTNEGYKMVLMEPVKMIDAGPIDIQIGNYYYFQKGSLIE